MHVEAEELYVQDEVLNLEDEQLFVVSGVQCVESESSYLEADVLHAEPEELYVLYANAVALFVMVEALYVEAATLTV